MQRYAAVADAPQQLAITKPSPFGDLRDLFDLVGGQARKGLMADDHFVVMVRHGNPV